MVEACAGAGTASYALYPGPSGGMVVMTLSVDCVQAYLCLILWFQGYH